MQLRKILRNGFPNNNQFLIIVSMNLAVNEDVDITFCVSHPPLYDPNRTTRFYATLSEDRFKDIMYFINGIFSVGASAGSHSLRS
jgi:hypothetical protein